MKTLSEFGRFYNRNIVPELNELERGRIRTRRNRKLIAVGAFLGCCVVMNGIGLARYLFDRLPGWTSGVGAIACFFMIGFAVFLRKSVKKEFARTFKTRAIARIVHFLDPALQYDMNGRIPESVFNQSRLFSRKPTFYNGDDLVRGKMGDTDIVFSEVHAGYIAQSGKRKYIVPIFDGLFFIADFNKHFKGTTWVLPDKEEKRWGGWGTKLQKIKAKCSGKELVKMEDPEFEKRFVVYGEDQITPRYILSTALMRRILAFEQKTDLPVFISFTDSKMYMGIFMKRTLFEPDLEKPLDTFKPFEQYFEDLILALAVVEDLNLNTRIWGKNESGKGRFDFTGLAHSKIEESKKEK